MLAGFEIPTEGSITIDGKDMEGVDPNRRPVNMVFQSYAVFPHMKVFDNVAYGLNVTGVAKDEISKRVEEVLGLVQLDGFGSRKPDQLSGGQRQRVAVMEAGKVRQIAPPSELYKYPTSRFVADFIGKMNLFEGRVTSFRGGVLEVTISGLGRLEIPHDAEPSGEIGIAIRPEKLRVTVEQPAKSCICFPAVLDNVAYHGSESHMFFTTDSGAQLTATMQNETRTKASFKDCERLWVSWAPGDTLVLAE